MLQLLRRSVNVAFQKLRKLFYVKDFVTLIRPYVFFMFVLGYFPYSISLSTLKLAKKNFVYSLIMVINISLLCSITVYNTAFFGKYITLRWSCISIFGFGLLCLWTSYLSSRSKLHFLRTVSTSSRMLSPETFCSTAKWMFAIDFIKIGFIMSFLSVVQFDLWLTVQFAGCVYILLVAQVANSLYVNSLYVVRLCFRKINTSLEKLGTSLVTDEPHLLRRVYHSQKNPMLLSELKTLRRQHLELCKIVDTSNEIFGQEAIVTLALMMTAMTFNLYMYLLQNTYNGKIVRFWSVFIVYLAHNCQSLIVMAVVCQMVKDQAKNIGYNIHRIHVITFDEEISTELSSFSMQALQQNHTIIAKGVVIDMTLLTKIVGVIATYLLILIQFFLITPC